MAVTIRSLHVYPIKSCRGWTLDRATLGEAGLEAYGTADRQYLVVDRAGRFVTQREAPRLARVRPAPDPLRAECDGFGSLPLPPTGSDGSPVEVAVWRDRVRAIDCGDEAARWFSAVLGRAARLVRFDRVSSRCADRAWTGRDGVPTRFADGYPYLIVGAETIADVDRRWQRAGHAPIGADRFRPNLVLLMFR